MAKFNFVSDMINDLRSFQRLLEKHMGGYILNIGVLGAAINQIGSPSRASWGYELPRLEFVNLDLGKVVCPNLDEDFVKNAVLELKLNISCLSSIPDPIEDPIQDFGVQIIINIRDLEKVVAKSFWRFELHPAKVKGAPANQPEFHHPLYHLHFGGHELRNDDGYLDYSNVLILDAPRIMHPPMDIVLAIDFVLNNFYSCHSCQPFIGLRSEAGYSKIVENARKRFWKPFAFGFASNFTTSHNFASEGQVSVVPTYAKNLLTYSEKH
jgi:hypothetical protein